MAIIVTFGEVGFRYSRFPKRHNVQENAKFQHEYSLMALLNSETEMFRNCERRRFLFDSPGFRNGKCSGGSGAPGFRNRKCLQVGVSLESEIGSSRIRDLFTVLRFWESDRSGAGPSPPASILGLDNVYWIWLDYCNEITKVNSSLAPCLVSFED
ncbi:unnamed protein product [Rhizophagus irregularis]|nr:unnamed protein product [Rhizophagus irregularis]